MSEKNGKPDNKRKFDVEVDGVPTTFAVLRPTNKVREIAQMHYSRAFRLAVKPEDGKPGAILADSLDKVLREQGLWDDERQQELEVVVKRLNEGELRLKRGGIKKSEARALAIEMRRDRNRLRALNTQRDQLQGVCAESAAENARFLALIAGCTVWETGEQAGKLYYKGGLDDLQSRENDPVVGLAGQALSKLLFGLEDDPLASLPENKFLVEHGYARAKDLHLVDKHGNLIDALGRKVDEQGRLLNDKGEWVDEQGNRVDENGELMVEFVPFLEDDEEGAKAEETVENKVEENTPVEELAGK